MLESEKYRVMAVDDNDDVLELIRNTLQDQYSVLTLSNPVDLYELLDVFEPDLLLLDIMMPRITGYQLIEILRKNPNTQDTPIIVLSAKSSPSEVKYGYRLGATLYLPKPFQADRLKKNLETQFKIHPPKQREKSMDMEQLYEEITVKPSYKKGYVNLTGMKPAAPIKVIDLRQKIKEKILQKRGRQ